MALKFLDAEFHRPCGSKPYSKATNVSSIRTTKVHGGRGTERPKLKFQITGHNAVVKRTGTPHGRAAKPVGATRAGPAGRLSTSITP
eukprot:363525-Chlamydomonas_euryale.AAC.9